MIYYILFVIALILVFFFLFLLLLKVKIEKLEKKIIELFKIKNNQIPSIFEVSKKYLNKHDDIFREVIKLKKNEFTENIFYDELLEKTNTYRLIHNELNFIFKVCNKHKKLTHEGNYLFIRDLIIEKSDTIGKQIKLYKSIVKKYNRLIKIKNITIIGLLFPIGDKKSI